MKRVTLLSTLAGALLYSTTAMAQVEALTNKYVKSVGTTPVTTLETGKWYVMENQDNYAYDDGTGIWSGAKSGLLTTGSVTTNCAKVLFSVSDIQAPVSVTETGTDNRSYTGDVYGCKIQWGTGKYVKWPTSFNQQVLTTDNVADAEVVYFAPVADNTGTVRFAQKTTTEYGDGNNTMFDKNSNGKVSNWAGNGQSKLVAKGNSANGVWKVYEVELDNTVDVTVNAYNGDATKASFSFTVQLPPVENVNLASIFPTSELLTFEDKVVNISAENNAPINIKYTEHIPFATTYKGLTDKWVSFFTLNGRMHVYDDNCVYNNVKKYPTIDKATFTNLTDRKFWGFICENPFTSSIVKIVNKAADEGKTLYLTSNTAGSDGANIPVLMGDGTSGFNTNEWVLEKGKNSDGTQYYAIKANKLVGGNSQYINNNALAGFMTTWKEGGSDNGSNIKFTDELDTYEILKERALSAPCNATHSLTAEARAKVSGATATVAGYKTVIAEINAMENEGVIPFEDGGYYYLRNYTPAGESETFALASTDGTKAVGVVIPSEQLGSESEDMSYCNINAIWKITKANPNDQGYTGGSQDIGVSKSIGRHVTHANSGKKLSSNINGNAAQLNGANSTFYFVNLGAGQHFMKNDKYVGDGSQAKDMPLGVKVNWTNYLPVLNSVNMNADGTAQLDKRYDGSAHAKNTHDTWYGIQVKTIKVTISGAGYSTLYLPFGVNLPAESDLKAYVVSATTDAKATMDEVSCIPANQGVILKGAANATYELTINDEAAWESVTNLLKGSNMHENITPEAGKTCYVLSMPAGAAKAGFYKAALNQENNTAFKNNDNKAYLSIDTPADGEAPSLSFVFDTETSINSISAAKADNVIYDLSGRRVKAATKGIFIMGGKKVIK